MTDELKRNLKQRMDVLGLKARPLSLQAGLNETAVRDILEGRIRSPTVRTIGALAKVLGCTAADLTGEKPRHVARESEREAPRDKTSTNSVHIAEYDVSPAAGHGAAPPDLGADGTHSVLAEWSLPRSMLEANVLPGSRLAVIRVAGDSMEPDYRPGDRVLIDLNATAPTPPGTFVLWDGLGLVLKQVEYLMNSVPPRLRIKSINPAYEAYDRDAEDVIINGRVIGKWTWR